MTKPIQILSILAYEADEEPEKAVPTTPGPAHELPPLAPWDCRGCHQPLTIEAIGPSENGQRTLTHWHCDRCEVAGVTPALLCQPPDAVTTGHVCTLFPENEADSSATGSPVPSSEAASRDKKEKVWAGNGKSTEGNA